MYKSRHFEQLKPKHVSRFNVKQGNIHKKTKSQMPRKTQKMARGSRDIRPGLLQVANAKIIGPSRLASLVEDAVSRGTPLSHYIVNMPKDQASIIRSRVQLAINAKRELEEAEARRQAKKQRPVEFWMPVEEPQKTIEEEIKEA